MLVLVFVAHFAGGTNWVLSNYALQGEVPDRLRGRVFATDMMLATLAIAVSQLGAAAFVDRVDERVILAGCGADHPGLRDRLAHRDPPPVAGRSRDPTHRRTPHSDPSTAGGSGRRAHVPVGCAADGGIGRGRLKAGGGRSGPGGWWVGQRTQVGWTARRRLVEPALPSGWAPWYIQGDRRRRGAAEREWLDGQSGCGGGLGLAAS